MDEKEVTKRMREALGKANELEPLEHSAQEQALTIQSFEEWLPSLPKVPKNGFLLDSVYKEETVIFCVKELDWQTAMNIDMKAYRVTEKDTDYYSEEYERRQTLSRAICWVADYATRTVLHNKDEHILEKINYDILDEIWLKYKTITSVTAIEAQKLYESTRRYLNNQAQEGVPIPSIVPKTIAICDGWCSLSSKELQSITAGDWERMQIVRMARADLMGVYSQAQIASNTKQVITHEVQEETSSDAIEFAKRFPIGHPNRPPGI